MKDGGAERVKNETSDSYNEHETQACKPQEAVISIILTSTEKCEQNGCLMKYKENVFVKCLKFCYQQNYLSKLNPDSSVLYNKPRKMYIIIHKE